MRIENAEYGSLIVAFKSVPACTFNILMVKLLFGVIALFF